jgi:5S rRNA maturation endonuclease (ribonuclease M5)
LKKRTHDYEVIDSLSLFVKQLNDEAENGALIVVEGPRDHEALRSIGFHGETFLLCHNEGLTRLAIDAEDYRRIILLFDLDSQGRSLTKKAAILLRERKKSIDLFFRRRLLSVTRGKVRHVEELMRYKEYIPPYTYELSRNPMKIEE